MSEAKWLSPRIYQNEAMMGTDSNGRYALRDTVEALQLEVSMLKQRLAQMGETEIDLHAKIIQLESDARGPHPFATWQEAAVDERLKRTARDKAIWALESRDREAQYLVGRWLETDKKHDWSGFQKAVEKFLGVNQLEPIPKNVRWDESMNDFYDTFYDFRTMGPLFREQWIHRKSEFTTLRNLVGTWP